MPLEYPRDALFNFVFNLRTPDPQDRNRWNVGSGFFVWDQRTMDVLVVTAAHVATETNAQTLLVINNHKGEAIAYPLSRVIAGSAWDYHPEADLACARFTKQDLELVPILRPRLFPSDQVNLGQVPLSRDDELTSIGFPHGYGVDGKFSPLSFRTFAASEGVTLPRADTGGAANFIVLENPSVGGYSGCPVFDLGYRLAPGMKTSTGLGTILHGIMHGTISDNTGGKMAAVTPASYLNRWLQR